MRVNSAAVGGRLSMPMTVRRTAVAGTNVPRLIVVPRSRSRLKKPLASVQSKATPHGASASTSAVSLVQYAGDPPSPMISVVMPWRR